MAMSDPASRILIVEDNQDFIAHLREILGPVYLDLFQAENGEAGLALAQKELPDLVLLDMIMPRMNGLEVSQALMEKPETAKIPIVIFTGSYFDAKTADLLKSQPNVKGWLAKNCGGKVLLAEVARVLALRPA